MFSMNATNKLKETEISHLQRFSFDGISKISLQEKNSAEE